MKILLADDEPIARTMLEHWLAGWGYQVTLARDGESALKALKVQLKGSNVSFELRERGRGHIRRHRFIRQV